MFMVIILLSVIVVELSIGLVYLISIDAGLYHTHQKL